MIIVPMQGGFDNQACQYAMYKKLKRLYPALNIKIDCTLYKHARVHNEFELKKIFGKDLQ